MLNRFSLWAIGAYQRHLSPRKGYACAYRLAHGGTGCSGFTKQAIAAQGLTRALPAIRRRFAACKVAAKELNETSERQNKPKKRRSRWYDTCDMLACCDLRLCGRGKSSGADASPDCTPDCAPDCCSL